MSRLRKFARESREKRVYEIASNPEFLDELEKMLNDMQACGSAGASRSFEMFIDGDGAFWIEVKKKGGELAKSEFNSEQEVFKYNFE